MIELASLAKRRAIKHRFKLNDTLHSSKILKKIAILGRDGKSVNQGRLKTINPAIQLTLNDYQMMTKEQMINYKAKKPRNTIQVWKKDESNKTDFLHDLANQLRKGVKKYGFTRETSRYGMLEFFNSKC